MFARPHLNGSRKRPAPPAPIGASAQASGPTRPASPGGPRGRGVLRRAAIGVVEALEQRQMLSTTPSTFQITGNASTDEGSAYSLNLPTSAPDGSAIQHWVVDWGDGTDPDNDGTVGQGVAGGQAVAVHTYGDGNADFRVTATATYAGGTSGGGSLDSTFNGNGAARAGFPEFNIKADGATAVALLPDGRVVAAGTTGVTSALYGDFAVSRYHPDGTPDRSFGGKGFVTTNFNGFASVAAVAVQQGSSVGPAGYKVIAAGVSLIDLGPLAAVPTVVRYNPDGTPDATFGTNGVVTLTGEPGSQFTSLAVTEDGHILAAGQGYTSGPNGADDTDLAVWRFNDDGTLDPGFGTNGRAKLDFGSFDRADSISLMADGRIVVAGHSNATSDGTPAAFAVARLLPGGGADPTFAAGGQASYAVGDEADEVKLTVDTLGAGVLWGTAVDGSDASDHDPKGFVLLRFSTNGTISPLARENVGEQESAAGVTVNASDGSILAAGRAVLDDGTGYEHLFFKYDAAGAPDTAFGANGMARPGTNDEGFSMAAGFATGPGGQIFLAGSASTPGLASTNFAVWQFDAAALAGDDQLPATPPPPQFVTDFPTPATDQGRGVAVLSDHSVLVAGTNGFTPADRDVILAKYTSGGQLDTTFGDGGLASVKLGPVLGRFESRAVAVTTDPAGNILKIYAAGTTGFSSLDGEMCVVRLNADGTADTSFGNGGLAQTAVYNPDLGGFGAAYDLVVQPGGGVLLGGTVMKADENGDLHGGFAVSRFDSSGVLDTGFGTDGIAVSSFAADRADGLRMTIDGTDILLAGAVGRSDSNGDNYDENFAVVRFDAGGNPVTSFGAGGQAEVQTPGAAADARGIVVLDDGILVAGTVSSNIDSATSDGDVALVKLTPGGTPDQTFGTAGVVVNDQGGGNEASDLAVVGGKLIVTGTLTDDTGSQLAVYRYDLSGAPDTAFGDSGIAAGPADSRGARGAADGSTKFVVVGSIADPSTTLLGPSSDISVARFDLGTPGNTTASSDLDVHVANVAPTLTVAGAATVNEGGLYTFSLGATDPGQDTISHWRIDWGDGAAVDVTGNPSSAAHTYADGPNGYSIVATAYDEDSPVSGYSAAPVAVGVNNVQPTLTLSGASTVNEGSTYTLGLAASDPGADTISGWTIDWGDGTVQAVAGAPASVTHIFADGPATRTVRARATDEDGTWVAGNTLSVSVLNVTPTVTLDGAATVQSVRQQAVTWTGHFTDPGADTWGAKVNYGDGTGTQDLALNADKSVTLSHVFTTTGNFTVTVRVRDSDGAVGEATRDVSVAAVQLQQDPAFPNDPTKTVLAVGGTVGADNISVTGASGGKVNVSINGTTYGPFSPTTRVTVRAGAGNDTVTFSDSVPVLGEAYGGAGDDDLSGGSIGSILVGGAGDDQVTGGSGRDLLIGSAGSDRIVGSAGDDILIAGYTSYDDNTVANYALWREWNRSDAAYLDRINHLQNGTGLNGAYALRVGAAGRTVFDDSAADDVAYDLLTGASGQDWFLYNISGAGVIDRVNGNTNGEVKTDINGPGAP